MKYLADYTGKDDNLALTLQGYGLSEETPAYGVSRLYDILKVKLEEENLGSLYRQVELPLSDVLCDMEECGVKIDRAASAQFEKRYKEEIAQATNSSVGTVKSRIARARGKLQDGLKSYI